MHLENFHLMADKYFEGRTFTGLGIVSEPFRDGRAHGIACK